jgi:LemA protein
MWRMIKVSYEAYPWGRWLKWVVIGVLLLFILGGAVSNYNGLVEADQRVASQWSQVENVMQGRADKITNLVEVVKGYVKHEEKVFGDIANARSALMSGSTGVRTKLEADAAISDATRGILVLVENYPDLKADQQFHDLSVAIEGSENRVSVERKRFIDEVQAYNTRVTRFPGNMFARVMGFEAKEYFQAAPGAQEAPKVKF